MPDAPRTPPAAPDDPFATGTRPAHPSLRPRTAAELDLLTAAPVHLPNVEGYEVLERLGHGGMGVVYKARDRKLDRIVALKMVLEERETRPTDLVRFLAEIELVAKLQHPNIVQVYGSGQHQGRMFFAMEYVAGGSLADRTNGRHWPDPREAAALIETIAHAVHHAHTLGIVHRDLKPANVLLSAVSGQSSVANAAAPLTTDNGPLTPKITDFGLAKLVQVDAELTQTGELLGTPSYMAPEIASGRFRETSYATDVYGLGAILYQLLTGRPPHKGLTILETLEQVKGQDPSSPRSLRVGLSRDLETICLKCLQKEPAQRYPTAAALADDLRRYLNDEPITARPVSSAERAWRWCRRNPVVASLSAALFLMLLTGLAVVTQLWRQAVAERAIAVAARQGQRAL
jgi:serine/threonine protein kinase